MSITYGMFLNNFIFNILNYCGVVNNKLEICEVTTTDNFEFKLGVIGIFFYLLFGINKLFGNKQVQEIPHKIKRIKKEEKYENRYVDKIKSIVAETNQRHLFDGLSNCFVFETTPLGNVIMMYNAKRETFEYYSDSSIPYRYLEPVCRKYVITFHCTSLYVDMDAELKECQQKILLQEKEKEMETEKNKTAIPDQKKSVFTKFKSYNVATGRVNTGAPAKNNIQNVKTTTNQNEKTILKDNANRYSYQGKIINFSILKKVDKKLVNKKYKMTFADFKNRVVS